jgi:hypothetical protein
VSADADLEEEVERLVGWDERLSVDARPTLLAAAGHGSCSLPADSSVDG